jgi:putative tryptophan/tyrosine transport system substrate-binding protein
MRRRGFIAVLGGAALWPLAGRAQQPERMPRVAVLMAFAETDPVAQASVSSFTQALERFGWAEGKNVRIDYRFAAADPVLFKTCAAELARLSPDVILASTPAAVAAVREQTHTIPIVFVLMVDPVGLGLVQSLARPGGNITGFSLDAPIMGKWLQLLKDIAPAITRVVVIFNPDTTAHAMFNSAIEAAAPSLGIAVRITPVHDDAAIEEAIATEAREPGGGVVCLPDPFNVTHANFIIAAAARHGLPVISTLPLARAGGLMSYYPDAIDWYVQAASYIDRILRGAKPADLPVQQPTKYSLIINLKTAKALGLTVPPRMLDLADEVIE